MIINRNKMQTHIRERFSIEERNAATASSIIKDTLKKGLIKEDDHESKSRKYTNYIPFWA